MKIIDAHFHFQSYEGFGRIAREAGHENTATHLEAAFRENNIALGIAMGGGRMSPDADAVCPSMPDLAGAQLPEHIVWCAGLDSSALTKENHARSLACYEAALRHPRCVGLKLYMGYQHIYLNDSRHHDFFDLARSFDVPVVMHGGDTAHAAGRLKYSHPLTVDEAAVQFPGTRFVIAHYGNPWIVDATAVAAKNPNVFCDLSGLAAGHFAAADFQKRYKGYLEHIQTWLAYLGDYEKVLYGSDWPLVNLGAYIGIMRGLIPEEEQEKFFCSNALAVFPKLRSLLR